MNQSTEIEFRAFNLKLGGICRRGSYYTPEICFQVVLSGDREGSEGGQTKAPALLKMGVCCLQNPLGAMRNKIEP
jgi:hypothetical protein